MAQVIASKKGGKVLVYRGYSYQYHKAGSDKKIWICTENRYNNCLGRLHSDERIPEAGELVEVLKESDNHNHTPDAASIEKKQVVNRIKATAAVSSDSTSSVVATAIQGASTACLGMSTQPLLLIVLCLLHPFHAQANYNIGR